MNDKKKIKKLAKKCLIEKWYPLKRGDKSILISDDCAFCKNIKKKGSCDNCYIDILIPNFCMYLSKRNINDVIETLEQLAEFGEL